MAKLLKLRRGTTTQHGSFTGAEGEVTIDTTKDTAVVHDGSTAGGTPLAKEDMSNVSSGSIAGRLGADSIATTKIAAGALPTDVTITNANIVANASIEGTKLENSGVSAGQYGSSTAIPIVTVDAQGLVTAASTTAIDSTKIQNGTTEVATASSGDITMKRSGTTRLVVDNDGVDVTGNINATGNIEISNAQPTITFTDTDHNPDFLIRNADGGLIFNDSTNAANRLVINSDGHVDVTGNLDVGAGLDVTGNVVATGEVEAGSLDINGSISPVQIDHTGGSGMSINRSSKNLTFNANYGAAGTHSAIDTNCTDLRIQTSGNDRLAVNSSGITVNGSVTADGISFIPSGTAMLFAQTSAPTGWTKSTTHNNKALRVVSGTAGSGGSNAFTTAFGGARGINANASNTTQGGNVSVSVANSTQGGNISVGNTTAGGNLSISNVSTGGTVNSHTLSVNEMPSHSHGATFVAARNQARQSGGPGISGVGYVNYQNNARQNQGSAGAIVNNTGGNGGHSHGFSGSSHNHNGTLSGTAHNHNANFTGSAHNHNATGSFTGSAHNHSISVGNLDMEVQYVDVIIATKD